MRMSLSATSSSLPALLLACAMSAAQQPAPSTMGTVATRDARVAGGLEVDGDRAKLFTNASVTAYARTAPIALSRGGEVLVCATSEFHLLHSGAGKGLLFGLDRGAVEIRSATDIQDVLLTPDIRFAVEAPGVLDLRLRVTREGDTCVDNAGSKAPVLLLSDAFSQATYRVLPGQHLLFERGNLREVVDHERDSCGCPPEPSTQVATDAGSGTHPFPAAVSAGLAVPAAPANAAPTGETHTQIATTITYGDGAAAPGVAPSAALPPSAGSTSGSPTGSGSGPAEPPKTPPGARDLAGALKGFFKRLFGRGKSS